MYLRSMYHALIRTSGYGHCIACYTLSAHGDHFSYIILKLPDRSKLWSKSHKIIHMYTHTSNHHCDFKFDMSESGLNKKSKINQFKINADHKLDWKI